ncbi:MAG: gliding motility protein GldL [Prevotella sp.]|jgi:gliding motility-associated protein GldL|nr:gliding motility protein GldL [Prevotella sp.]
MGEYSKYNIVYRLQKWMDSVPGQTFLNYAYSWGASIVILGTLFKLTHLPGANFMLFLGMGTEVCVFFISAFDRPFDKTADGRNLPTHITEEDESVAAEGNVANLKPTSKPAGNVVIIGSAVHANNVHPSESAPVGEQIQKAEPLAEVAPLQAQPNFVPQMSSEDAAALNEAQGNYVEELKKLVDTLQKVNEQSTRLTRDSEEMENLNRTLTGISKVYEIQLKGASQQIGTIDQINEQSKKLAQHIEQLNKIYTRMIEAMTVNMRAAAPGAAPTTTEG